MRFGGRLRALRKARGLTQEQVAIAAEMDRSFYVELENGVHSVLLDRIFDIAAVLNVPMKDLFE